jgi:hypothetical protein
VNTADAAVMLAEHGWHVFPCRPGDKRPAVDRWEQRACADPDRVARFWPSPKHNIGIATGPSGLVVLDLDTHGELPDEWHKLPGIRDGRDVLAQLCEWVGQPWPSTYIVVTPSGGWHMYYAAPEGSTIRNSASLLGPMVDVRARGGYVVAGGSAVGGRPYEVLDAEGPAPLPAWIHRLLTTRCPEDQWPAGRGTPGGHLQGLLRTVEKASEGQRNDALFWAANRVREMAAAGEVSPFRSVVLLVDAAVAAGLPEAEARRTIASGLRGDAR